MTREKQTNHVGREIVHFVSTALCGLAPLVGGGISVAKAIGQYKDIVAGHNYEFMSPDSVMPYAIITFLITALSYQISQATRDPNSPPNTEE